MLALTPSERRGALVLVVLLLIGAGHDLWRARGAGGVRPVAERPAPTLHPAGSDEAWAPVARLPEGPAADPQASPGSGRDSVPSGPPPAPGVARAPLDLNRANARELDDLPGVGPVLAGRIVLQRRRYGPFHGVEELLAVRGVGPRLLERIRPWAMVGPPRGEASPPVVTTPDSMAESRR